MNSNVKKIIEVFALVIFIFFIYFFIKNYSIVRNKDLQVAPLINKIVAPDTSINNTRPVNEDADVYGQRQLRADFNNGSSTGGY